MGHPSVSVSCENCPEETEVSESNTEKNPDIETNLMCIDEWYHEESGEEIDSGNQEETASTEVVTKKESGEEIDSGDKEETASTELVTKDGNDLTDIKEKRDLLDFLRMDIKHDVWKEIKATKAEIRKLEKEVRGKRKPEDRSQ